MFSCLGSINLNLSRWGGGGCEEAAARVRFSERFSSSVLIPSLSVEVRCTAQLQKLRPLDAK